MGIEAIQRFEYQRLTVRDCPRLRPQHLQLFERYFESTKGKYFSLVPGGVCFANYVGVIQVGDLTIEILPKADKTSGNSKVWKAVLLDMLRECHWMQVDASSYANLKLKTDSVLENYILIFLKHCEALLHRGLIRKYRRVEENCTSLKGKLQFSRHLRYNLVHQERFFVDHGVLDRHNVFNRVLVKALRLIPTLVTNASIADFVGRLILDWPELTDIIVDEQLFDRLVFDRKTEAYREAIFIAKMILLNYRPDISGGNNHMLAILFDMNELWEEFIFRRVRKAGAAKGMQVTRQRQRTFWEGDSFSKVVKPDILVHTANKIIVLDTKWKIYENLRAIDDELKQMYVYSRMWNASKTAILSPFNGASVTTRTNGFFHESSEEGTRLGQRTCKWLGVNILSNNPGVATLSSNIGEEILINL